MSAIRAAYVDFKLVKTRSMAQLIFEVPIEEAEPALALLGIPQPGKATWCAVAVLNDSAAGTLAPLRPDQALPDAGVSSPRPEAVAAGRPAPHPLVRDAGMLCHDERFWRWAGTAYDAAIFTADDAAIFVRQHCGVASRTELPNNPQAARIFRDLLGHFRDGLGQSTWERPA